MREDVYWQRDVKQVYIFSEETGESLAGNLTAGRIIELSNGTHSVRDIVQKLMTEFSESPNEEEILEFVTEFLAECEEKQFIELRASPADVVKQQSEVYTIEDVKALIKADAIIIINEKASFEPTEDGALMTYSLKEGRYLMLSDEEKEVLTVLLEEKPLQEVLADVEVSLGKEAQKILTDFVGEMLNHELARVQND